MSHFSTIVLVDPAKANPKKGAAIFNKEIARLLAPYNENVEVPEYEKACGCKNSKAYGEATKLAVKETGKTIEDLRQEYNVKVSALFPRPEDTESNWEANKEYSNKIFAFQESAEGNKLWKEISGEYFSIVNREVKRLESIAKPNPECETCKGTGVYMTNYNPKSQWDWYVIGGRWTGLLTGYNPYEDPANFQTCSLCEGTGKRNDDLGKQQRATYPDYTCNGCDGKGKSVKWNLNPYEKDILAVSDITRPWNEIVPFAIITPDGEWHEQGDMGWWGIVTDEKDQKVWKAEALKILNTYKDHIAVVVDCHI